MQPIIIIAYALVYLAIGALGLHIISNPANEEEATTVAYGNELFRRIFDRSHADTSQLDNEDYAIIPEIQKMASTMSAPVTKGAYIRKLWSAGGHNKYKSRNSRIRPSADRKRVVRDFGEKDVLCYPGDLHEHHPQCKCCGGWENGYMGETCATPIHFDCTEGYKKTHFRPTRMPAYY